MKKLITLVLILVAVAIFAYPKTKEEVTTITFSTWGSQSEMEILKPMLEEFEKQNPKIKVELLHFAQNYFQKLHLLFASNSAPDVVFMNNLYLPFYANAGVLEELDNRAEFEEKSLQALSYNSKLYAIPRDISLLVMFINEDLFNCYDIDKPNADWTLDDMLILAKLFKKETVFGISFEDDPPLFYLPYLMSEGGAILSDDTTQNLFNSEKTQKALGFYADLRTKYHVAPSAAESANLTMAQLFLQQKLAMHLTGHWLIPKYTKEAKFNWSTLPFPSGSLGSIVPLDASGWAISKSSNHKDEARALIEFLSSKENISKFTSSELIVPARKDVLNGEFLKKPHNKAFVTAIKTAKPTPVSPDYVKISNQLRQETQSRFTMPLQP